jgi:hypothetical protein
MDESTTKTRLDTSVNRDTSKWSTVLVLLGNDAEMFMRFWPFVCQ